MQRKFRGRPKFLKRFEICLGLHSYFYFSAFLLLAFHFHGVPWVMGSRASPRSNWQVGSAAATVFPAPSMRLLHCVIIHNSLSTWLSTSVAHFAAPSRSHTLRRSSAYNYAMYTLYIRARYTDLIVHGNSFPAFCEILNLILRF